MATQQTSLAYQKVRAYLKMIQDNEEFWNSALVFLGTLFLFNTFTFYPNPLNIFLAILCGAVAYKVPWAGTGLGMVLAFPAVAYQSAPLAWLFTLLISLTFFQMFTQWAIISALQILILSPFAFHGTPFGSFFGWFTIIGMLIAAFHFGSKKSLGVASASVFLILLFSSIWLMENSAYLPINMKLYQPANQDLMISKGTVDIIQVIPTGLSSLANLATWEAVNELDTAMGKTFSNVWLILFHDTGIMQILGWAVVLYLVGFLSGAMRNRRSQTIASIAYLLIIPVYYFIANLTGTDFQIEFAGMVGSSVVLIAILEQFEVKISKEEEINRNEKTKKFGKFGLQDMGLGSSEVSLKDVGGYEDVKDELKESIITPLEKKELAYTYGMKAPSGILLFGPPGTGKTMLMRALAKELKYGFYYVKSSDVMSQWHGESLPYDENILTKNKNGKIRFEKIGKIVESQEKVEVLSFDEQGNTKFSKIKDYIKHKSTSPIYEIKTRSGRKIKVTKYHSLFTLNGTKIEPIKTTDLVPNKSYIAIPKKIEPTKQPIEEIDFIELLKENDHKLYIKNIQRYINLAIERVGISEVTKILGYKNRAYLRFLLKRNIGIRISKFMKLIEKSEITIDKKELFIGINKKLPAVIPISEDFATFIGMWIAEGSYNQKNVLRISIHQDELENIKGLCEKLFGKVCIYKKTIQSKGIDIYIGNRPLYVLFREILGLKGGAKIKKVPEIAFSFTKKNISALLRGYFTGDGSFYSCNRNVGFIEAGTVSQQLANDILYLLLYFGIVARIYDKKEYTGSITNRITFIGYEQLDKFSEIGFLDNKRNDKLKKYLKNINWHRSEQIPITGNLREIVNKQIPKHTFSNTIGKNILSANEIDDELEFLEMIENDIYLDKIKEIKQVKDEGYVYDISIDKHQNFVAGFGGIFAHNSERNISEIFEIARKNAPSILFFDEIDSIGKKRSMQNDDVAQRVLSIMLQQIDGGIKSKKPVIVIGATNVPNQIDEALLRPGRLDKIIYMPLPDKKTREAIFKVQLRNLPVDDKIDYKKLAEKTERFSGADLKNIINEAIKITAKEAVKKGVVVPIRMEHIMEVVGRLKPSTSIASLDEFDQFRTDFERRIGTKEEENVAKKDAVKWEDVIGLDQVKTAFLETIEFPLLHEEEMKEMKIKPAKGILLFGPPGTGKTLIVKAASSELNASFQVLTGAEIVKRGYSQAVSIIKETFNRARENTPAIIFVDEIETIAPSRGAIASEVTGQFLTEMDGIKELKGVVVVGTTNRPSALDTAILRPGRFDKIFYIPPPNEKGRADMFRLYLGDISEGLDLKKLGKITSGFTGADISSICQQVKMDVLRQKIAGNKIKMTTEAVADIIKTRRPSLTEDMLKEYSAFLKEYGERK